MIRINLLVTGRKKAFAVPPVIIYGIVALVILLAAMAGVTLYMNGSIAERQAAINVKQQKLTKLKAALAEVKNYERDNREFREKTRVIEQLKKKQIVPLRLLDEVSEMLPQGVWLTELKDKSGLTSIDGYAFSNSDLVSYVQSLKKSAFLANVSLIESRQVDLGDFSVYKFRLSLRVKV